MKRKFTMIALAALVFASMALVSGCDPTKTGGGGYPQPYNPSNGQYK